MKGPCKKIAISNLFIIILQRMYCMVLKEERNVGLTHIISVFIPEIFGRVICIKWWVNIHIAKKKLSSHVNFRLAKFKDVNHYDTPANQKLEILSILVS